MSRDPDEKVDFKITLDELESSAHVSAEEQVEGKPEVPPPDAVSEEWRRPACSLPSNSCETCRSS